MLGNILSTTMQTKLITYVSKHGSLCESRRSMAWLTDGDVIVFIIDCCTSGNRGLPWNQMYSRHAQVSLSPAWKNLCWVLLCPPATILFSLPFPCQTFWMKNGATHHSISSTPPPAHQLPSTSLLKTFRGHLWTMHFQIQWYFLHLHSFDLLPAFDAVYHGLSPPRFCPGWIHPLVLWVVSTLALKHGLSGPGFVPLLFFFTLSSLLVMSPSSYCFRYPWTRHLRAFNGKKEARSMAIPPTPSGCSWVRHVQSCAA